jgi:uncharacterized repeat protein (TIGR03803 family)
VLHAHPHRFRDTFAVDLLCAGAGVGVYDVARMLGDTVETIEKHYAPFVPALREQVRHSFTGGTSDGCFPAQGLVTDKSGNLYGTTSLCGANGNGMVFKLDSAGKSAILHSFAGGPLDGNLPQGGHVVRDNSGNLYGVTYGGGSNACPNGCGVLYKLGTNGKLTVLHRFAGGISDGCEPYAGIVRGSHGNLYGTTMGCGAHNWGTVFKLDSGGKETILHSFAGDAEDGAIPYGEVLRTSSGELFGTASSGGSVGWGTVWSYVP